MKTLVATLSAFAKDLGNDVQVWVNGGAELAADPAFVEAIDGMYIENLYYDFDGSNANATADVQHTLGQLKNVLNAGRPVIDVEYVAGDAKKIADVHRRAAAAGIGTYIGALDLNGIDLVDNPASSSPLK
jgi:cysteinyl-tRNA synthetase